MGEGIPVVLLPSWRVAVSSPGPQQDVGNPAPRRVFPPEGSREVSARRSSLDQCEECEEGANWEAGEKVGFERVRDSRGAERSSGSSAAGRARL